MKNMMSIALGSILLMGCTSSVPMWEQENQISVSGVTMTLNSHLWVDNMPIIGEEQKRVLHGALYIESPQLLPAELDVKSVIIRQGEDVWIVDNELLELRNHNENRWEIAFAWQLSVDEAQPLDIAVSFDGSVAEQWLIEKNITIEQVH